MVTAHDEYTAQSAHSSFLNGALGRNILQHLWKRLHSLDSKTIDFLILLTRGLVAQKAQSVEMSCFTSHQRCLVGVKLCVGSLQEHFSSTQSL